MLQAALQIFAQIGPYLIGLLILALLAALVAFGSDATQEAFRSEYEQGLRNLLAIAGPTAAAAIGDLALNASRPKGLADASFKARTAYLFSRWASWLLFGIIGGGLVAIAGWPGLASWMAAGVCGALGTNVVNIVFNRLLDRWSPPGANAGGAQ